MAALHTLVRFYDWNFLHGFLIISIKKPCQAIFLLNQKIFFQVGNQAGNSEEGGVGQPYPKTVWEDHVPARLGELVAGHG